jgi:hypothetical protein
VICSGSTPLHHLMIMDSSVRFAGRRSPLAVVGTLSKGYDLDYICTQVDPSLAMNPAAYYIGDSKNRWS